jgi:hypothetical protein
MLHIHPLVALPMDHWLRDSFISMIMFGLSMAQMGLFHHPAITDLSIAMAE